MRFVQLTPPGSACSITIGQGIVDSTPGSTAGLQLVVADIDAARTELLDRGVEVGEVQEFPWGSFLFFADPDGNRWSVRRCLSALSTQGAGQARAKPTTSTHTSCPRSRASSPGTRASRVSCPFWLSRTCASAS